MAFPQDPLDVQVELNITGQGWTDVTGDVYLRDKMAITGGRRDEGANVDPGKATLTLNNRDGKYSDRNPRSEYFGKLGRNTPIRVSVDGDESYLEILEGEGRCSTPASSAIAITGDLDVRVEATGDWYGWAARGISQSFIGQFPLDPAGQWVWVLLIDSTGHLRLDWSTDGTTGLTAFQALPEGIPERAAFRAVLTKDDGTGVSAVALYWAASLDGPWTEIFSSALPQVYTLNAASTAHLQVPCTGFPEALHGRVHRAEVYNAGVLIAAPDFRALAPGTSAFSDAAGLPWAVSGDARVTDRAYRFTGEVSAWPQRWDVSGNDAWVPLTAAGVLRRMGQGTKALQSTLRRRIPSADPAPIAYWPMEEGEHATQAYSPLPGVGPLDTSGLNWAADDELPAAAPLPAIKDGSSVHANFRTSDTGGWHIEMVYKANPMPSQLTELWRVGLSGSTNQSAFRILVGNNSLRLETFDHDGAIFGGFTSTDPDMLKAYSNGWTRMQIYAGVEDSGAAYWALGCMDITTNIIWYTYFFDAVGTVPGAATSLSGDWTSGFSGFALGHIGVFSVPGQSNRFPGVTVYDGADDAFTGETTIARMRRISGEEDLPLRISGDPDQTEQVGPQRVDTILNLIQSAADVDGGLLHEQRDSLALAYRARHTLYNQPVALTLDYTARGEVMPPLEPTEDDQATRNDVTVKREGGSSARAVQETGPLNVADPPEGVGRYDTQVTLNAWSDDQLLDLAGWRLHLGTWDGARYPSVHVALHAAPHLIPAVRDLQLLDRMQIINPPKWVPPEVIDLMVEGYTETLGLYSWDLVFNCSPAGLWTVGETVADSGAAGTDEANRADTSGAEVAIDATAAATELVVHTPQDGPNDRALWVTSTGTSGDLPDEFPLDVTVAGERVRVAACEPRAWDLFDRTEAVGWGTMTSGKVWNTTGGTTTDYTVDGTAGAGLITLTGDATLLRFGEYFEDLADCELLMCLSVDQTATGGDFLVGGFARAAGGAFYWCNLAFESDGGLGVEVRSNTAVIDAREATGYGYDPDGLVWLRMRVDGDRVLGRAWPDGVTEPGGWQVDRLIDVGTSASGTLGVAAASTATNTDVVISVHEFRLVDPQQMTVTRALNGVTKTQSAGADVRLAQPCIAAL